MVELFNLFKSTTAKFKETHSLVIDALNEDLYYLLESYPLKEQLILNNIIKDQKKVEEILNDNQYKHTFNYAELVHFWRNQKGTILNTFLSLQEKPNEPEPEEESGPLKLWDLSQLKGFYFRVDNDTKKELCEILNIGFSHAEDTLNFCLNSAKLSFCKVLNVENLEYPLFDIRLSGNGSLTNKAEFIDIFMFSIKNGDFKPFKLYNPNFLEILNETRVK